MEIFNPDFIKIVNNCKDFGQLLVLLHFVNYVKKEQNNITTVFALGKYSKLSRVIAEMFNMPIVYTALGEQYQTVDNQITYNDLIKIVEILK
jgi:3-dehydroquinate dehydratase